MKTEECITMLKAYNRWRRGSGRKYSVAGVPDATSAIDFAIRNLRCITDADALSALCYASTLTLDRMRKSRKSCPEGNRKPLEDCIKHLSQYVRAAKRVIARLDACESRFCDNA